MHRALRCILPFILLLPIGCDREPATSPPPQGAAHGAGLMEITITGIGTPQQRATVHALPAPRVAATGAAVAAAGLRPDLRAAYGGGERALTVLPDTDATFDGTVQLDPVSTASFTWGTRAGGGYRYVSATYRVRNATEGEAAYGNARTNLTFLAVSTASTLSGTAISTLKRFDGSAAASGLATQILPTGWADLSQSATLTARAPDVLQVYTESEIAATTKPADVTSILPYGFVVRNPGSTTDRTLAASPGASQFDGLVTFAFKVPLQATAADDPFTISAMFLPVDDDEAWVTQSAEEADAGSETAAENRATSLAANVRSFLGTRSGTTAAQLMCDVRTAGTAAAPTASLPAATSVDSLSPSPFGVFASRLVTNVSIAASFGHTMSAATYETFVVNSYQGGRAFNGGVYGGAGTVTLSTPAGAYWPGDVFEVALTTGLTCSPRVYRYRIATGSASASFTAYGVPDTVGFNPASVALGDLNGDGKLDIVTGLSEDTYYHLPTRVSVQLGNDSGRFTSVSGSPYTVSGMPKPVVLGDLDGDGDLDIVAGNGSSGSVTVLLNDGTGQVTAASGSPISIGGSGASVALGDVNGDGDLDIVAANGNSNVTVLLNDSAGTFTAASGSPFDAGAVTDRVALGDINQDGRLDIVGTQSGAVAVLLGDGRGGFSAASWSPFALTFTPSSLELGDFSRDGRLDWVAVSGSSVAVMLANASGEGFTAATGSPFTVGTNPYHATLGDFNGDGWLDFVSANWSSNNVTVLLANGTGGFNAASGFAVGNGPVWVTVGDVNGDGRLDIAAANGTQPSVTILLNAAP